MFMTSLEFEPVYSSANSHTYVVTYIDVLSGAFSMNASLYGWDHKAVMTQLQVRCSNELWLGSSWSINLHMYTERNKMFHGVTVDSCHPWDLGGL